MKKYVAIAVLVLGSVACDRNKPVDPAPTTSEPPAVSATTETTETTETSATDTTASAPATETTETSATTDTTGTPQK